MAKAKVVRWRQRRPQGGRWDFASQGNRSAAAALRGTLIRVSVIQMSRDPMTHKITLPVRCPLPDGSQNDKRPRLAEPGLFLLIFLWSSWQLAGFGFSNSADRRG